MIIDRLPPFVQRFFSPMDAVLSRPQFAHLWGIVLAVVVSLRAAKLVHLSAVVPGGGHRTSRGRSSAAAAGTPRPWSIGRPWGCWRR